MHQPWQEGGIGSDIFFKYVGFRGRIWAQFLALFFEAIFLFGFGMVDSSQPWYVALAIPWFVSPFLDSAGILAKIGEGGKTWATVGSKNEQGATGSGVCTGWSWWKFRSCHCWVLLLPTHQRSAAFFSSPCRLCHVLGITDPLLLLARAWWHVPWPCSQDTQGGCSIYGNYCVRLCRRVCVPSNFQGCRINFVAKA